MDPARIAVRCLASFIILITLVRMSGKRAVSEATAFDFVLSLIVGDLVDDAIFAEVPLANFLVAAGTLYMLEIAACILAHRSDTWMWWLEGRPGMMLQQGELNSKVMSEEHLNERDVAFLLRLEGFEKEKWVQVKLATLEAEGQTGVLKKAQMKSAQKKERKWLKGSNG
jgi:uncharacterized membrane protein YcaP (DUF421 family)